ncbi:hypothetical protein [Falsibacillus pallidus]|uniref:Uncharacterized protein n=1 Tax=Falsibacillus pallidus TaxID=493781 RepID=A0A370G3H2_9BACI|nr:hypothetical protein [Falsibacillus pallidus]RDI37556.1 hypothetical protein DFR59_12153 [Falsibacillus pallidus]
MEFGIHFSAYLILAALGIMIAGRVVQWFLRMTANLDNLDEKVINKGRQITIFLIGVCLLVLATLTASTNLEITFVRKIALLVGWLSAICFSMMPLLVYILERFSDKKQ